MNRNAIYVLGAVIICAVLSIRSVSVIQAASDDEDKVIADSLAAMLRAGRTVISRNQERINNPDIGDKGLDGKTVLDQVLKIYQETINSDPLKIDPSSRHGRRCARNWTPSSKSWIPIRKQSISPASASKPSFRRRSVAWSTKASGNARSMMPR